jgi:hypothetical protein
VPEVIVDESIASLNVAVMPVLVLIPLAPLAGDVAVTRRRRGIRTRLQW